jgi:hypothetical protein
VLSERDKTNPGAVYDPELFRREILPRLGGVPLAVIVNAIGCSKASDIRRGKRTPHVSTWSKLAALASAEVEFACFLTLYGLIPTPQAHRLS